MNDFWNNKKVFVTGHTGFKGSWLSLCLADQGAKVKGYSLAPNTEPNHYALIGLTDMMNSEIGDIRDREKLTQSMAEFAPDVVLHLAAQSLVRESYQSPLDTWDSNVMGTANFLEAVRHTPSVRSAVIITTDKCYENLELERPFKESDRLGGKDPYSASKAACEILTHSYVQSFFSQRESFGLATARAGNVVGGGDWCKDRLIPDMVRAFAKKEIVVIRNLQATRPWQHVLDITQGYLSLAKALFEQPQEFSRPWNFGPENGAAASVETVVTGLCKYWGPEAKWQHKPDTTPFKEATFLALDPSDANEKLHWSQKLKIEKTLDWTVGWYLNWLEGGSAKDISLRQIKEYQREYL